MSVEANDARFWVVEKGEGGAVLFFHFGLGDWRVFEPQLDGLADDFRCIAYDRRFYGRTEARFVEVDSDHYLTLREPELVTGLISDFLLRSEEVPSG